jgi:phosphoenolpyruvate carboxykinase (ATP)
MEFTEPSRALLITRAVRSGFAELSAHGAVVVKTGAYTGRAADDKYVVSDEYSEKHVNWENKVTRLSAAQYTELRGFIFEALKKSPETFHLTREVGASSAFKIKATLHTPGATHALFFQHMMRDLTAGEGLSHWTIYHAPFNSIPQPNTFGIARGAAVVMNYGKREILIAGTAYAGEIKKSLFSVMNTILPEKGVLPMHAGANVGTRGDVSVFFGLSGTGKTTLSTDEGRTLIGDDEHGLSDEGVFNFEGGCYAKTANLSQKEEPQIFGTTRQFATLLENVVLDDSGVPQFHDLSLTENGRASYPLSVIEGVKEDGLGPVAQDLFFLSADALGVLPPVACLSPDEAMKYFLCGYTSKLAGTEVGVKEPKMAFSYCFGAPFMMRRPIEYAQLLKEQMLKHNFKVWLINTGWAAGGYGKASRFPIHTTRHIIRSIQAQKVDTKNVTKDPIFGFAIPFIEGVDEKLMHPWKGWSDQVSYQEKAHSLKAQIEKQFATFGVR